MQNFIQPGNSITVTAPSGGTTSGVGVLIGSLFGIAATTEAAGNDVVLVTEGAFNHAKTSAQAWATLGLLIYWDDTNKVMTTSSSGNKLVGVNTVTAANPSATGAVRLNGAFIS